jgi:hypothetical protein
MRATSSIRIGIASCRTDTQSGQVIVRLEEIGDPARKVDKRCRVELAAKGADAIAISAAGRSWQDTFDAAIAPLRQRVVMRLRQATAGRISHANAPRPGLAWIREPAHAFVPSK